MNCLTKQLAGPARWNSIEQDQGFAAGSNLPGICQLFDKNAAPFAIPEKLLPYKKGIIELDHCVCTRYSYYSCKGDGGLSGATVIRPMS